MARILIVGGEARAARLAAGLTGAGHAVRATARDPEHLAPLTAAGAEAVLADPDRVGSVYPALAGVAVACVLLGSVDGSVEQVRALHTTRLEMLLTKLIDTTVRGLLWEGAGTVDPAVLAGGAELVRGYCERSRIPYVISEEPVAADAGSLARAEAAIGELLAGPSPG